MFDFENKSRKHFKPSFLFNETIDRLKEDTTDMGGSKTFLRGDAPPRNDVTDW